jgi:hypothetical protein
MHMHGEQDLVLHAADMEDLAIPLAFRDAPTKQGNTD